MKPNASPSAARRDHAWKRARALGFEAATSGTINPYRYGTQCWIAFEQGKAKGIEAKHNQSNTTKTS